MSMQDRVESGMAFLDRAVPNWLDFIDTELIDIQDMEDCILGQCFGDYNTGLPKVGLQSDWQAYQHGFLDWTGFAPQWMWDARLMPYICGRKLSKVWKDAVIKRMDQKSLELLAASPWAPCSGV